MLSRHEVEMSHFKTHTEFLHHIIQFLSHWIGGSVYEKNLRARFHVHTKHIFIGPYLCCPYTCLYIYSTISTHYLLGISMTDISNSHYNSSVSANAERT
jgi:hypothetical protein